MKMESLQQRREELEKKEHKLKESLLKFDKFLKENDSKRARALKKSLDERELRKTKEKDIDKYVLHSVLCTYNPVPNTALASFFLSKNNNTKLQN